MPDFETADWSLIYTAWEPSRQPLREALCALGRRILSRLSVASGVRRELDAVPPAAAAAVVAFDEAVVAMAVEDAAALRADHVAGMVGVQATDDGQALK